MKHLLRISLLLACTVLVTLPGTRSRSGDFTVTVTTPRNDVSLSTLDDGTTDVTLSARLSGGNVADAGYPVLPYRLVRVLLPRGTSFDAVEVEVSEWETLAEEITPRPARAERIPGATMDRVNTAPPLASRVGGVFPSSPVTYLGTGTWHGRAVAGFAVFPLRSEDGALRLAPEIALTVRTRTTESGAVTPVLPARTTAARRIERMIAGAVVNPEAQATYSPLPAAPRPPGGFRPTAAPSLEGSPVEHVIVTTDALAATYQRLADWRTARGTPSVVRTTSWIEQNYRNGSDVQETVRAFIRDAYEKWGVTSVLLGGDTSEIPPRILLTTYYYGGKDIAADIYFAGLDGTWNDDHDAVFGEHTVDSPDLYAEVNVCRLPASTVADVDLLIDKIIDYETAVDASYADKALFLAEVLFPSPWNFGDPIATNGADMAEYLITRNMQTANLRLERSYETDYLFPGSAPESRQAAVDSMNAGFNLIFHIGHGYRFNMHCADTNVDIPDADGLVNGNRQFNLYMLNCGANSFEYDCLGEHFLRNKDGGAVSVIGASNSAFATASLYYMDEYANLLFEQDVVRIGEAYTRSRLKRTPFAYLADNPDYWTHMIYASLADPAMQLFTGPAQALAVTLPDTIETGVATFDVTVTSEGSPQDSAVVCLWKGVEDYQVKATDALGVASFTFNTATPGDVSVVVTGHNRAAYVSTVPVAPTPGALLGFAGATVDDDSLGGTYGNGDGVIDAGEVIDLTPAAENTGDVTSGSATMTLSTASPLVTIIDNTATVPAVGAGQTETAGDPWRISLQAASPDESACEFDVSVTDGVGNWDDTFTRLVHAPSLEFDILRVDDSVYGNNDGVIQSLETFQLFCSLKNYGTGSAYGLGASVADAGVGGVSVSQGADAYPDIAPLEASENVSGFVISEVSTLIENPIAVNVVDAFGRTVTDTIELRSPLPPSNLQFDAGQGEDRIGVVWDASASLDVNRYHVYHSTTQGGPYQRASLDPVLHTTFVDAGLASSTRYYYVVTAIDSSGNESAPAAESSVSTNPQQAPGWPNVLADGSSNSPIVGDIDADGDLEVIVGNDYLYAWHHDGTEVRDGDGEALTYGVFSDQGADFIGPAALAKIDSDFGLDIVAASWSTMEVYVFNHTGAVLPGWPQPTVNRVRASCVVGDLDGDGDPEILAVDQDGYLYAWHHDGNEVRDGDSNPLTTGVFKRFPDTPWWQYQTPALADIDNDGREEIIIGTQDAMLYVLNDDGSAVPGWPRALTSYAGGGVAVGDIDNNGDLDIVISVKDAGEVLALRPDNTLLWIRWFPHNLFFNPSPALADIDGNGTLETFLPSSNGNLYGLADNGADLPGWPVSYSTTVYTESSPLIADVSGDGILDVILGDEERFIKAWSSDDGHQLDGFPLATEDAMRGTPAIADIDRDGTLEIIAAGYDRTVYVWNFSAPFDGTRAPWPMKHGNWHRNGTYGYLVPTAVRAVSFAHEILDGGVAAYWEVPLEMGSRFDVDRARMIGGDTGAFAPVATGLVSRGGSVELIDRDVRMGETYVYRLTPEYGGEPFVSGKVRVPVSQAAMEQNYPNPFNPTTTIVFYVPERNGAVPVRLSVYDVTGARVRTLVDSELAPGRYALDWNGVNDDGSQVGSGVYFYRVVQPGFSATRKMVLLK